MTKPTEEEGTAAHWARSLFCREEPLLDAGGAEGVLADERLALGAALTHADGAVSHWILFDDPPSKNGWYDTW